MITDYYKLLKIEPSADLEAIKKTFRKEITIYHPENNTSPTASAHFDLLIEAFEILSKSEKRQTYDALLSAQAQFKPQVIQQNKDYTNWQKEAKTNSKTYRESSLSDFFLMDVIAEAGFDGLIAGSETLIAGLGDTLGDIIGGVFDGL